MQKVDITKCDMARQPASRAKGTSKTFYTKQEHRDGCESAYALGLMDGEEGYVVKPDVTGMYSRVRVQNIHSRKGDRKRGGWGEATMSPHDVQTLYKGEWVTVIQCPNQDRALAFMEDLVVILARAEKRKDADVSV